MDNGLIEKMRNYFITQPVSREWFFGSVARGEDNKDSDVDLLVDFDEGVGLFKYSSMIGEIEDLLKKAVDLVSLTALLPWVKESVEHDKILIYERKA